MTIYKGSCHCGAVTVELETNTDPAKIDIRQCQCSFCRAHDAMSASDRAGSIRYIEHQPGAINHYQFGTNSCKFILCQRCGIYLGASMEDKETEGYATTQIKHYEDSALFTKPPRQAHYDDEDLELRLERRRRTWTPIALRT